MHSKLTKFLCLQLQFIPDLSRFLSTNRQQTELLKKSNAASISGSFGHVVQHLPQFPLPLIKTGLVVVPPRPPPHRPVAGPHGRRVRRQQRNERARREECERAQRDGLFGGGFEREFHDRYLRVFQYSKMTLRNRKFRNSWIETRQNHQLVICHTCNDSYLLKLFFQGVSPTGAVRDCCAAARGGGREHPAGPGGRHGDGRDGTAQHRGAEPEGGLGSGRGRRGSVGEPPRGLLLGAGGSAPRLGGQ